MNAKMPLVGNANLGLHPALRQTVALSSPKPQRFTTSKTTSSLSMVSVHRIFDGRRLLVLLSLLLSVGFFATTLGSYFVSKNVIRQAIIGQELPLASSNIYVELQKDLVQPVVISSTMAHDTFLRDWVLKGEQNVDELNRYLQ